MDAAEIDYWLQWIISDYTPFTYGERSFFLATPIREARFNAEQIYKETLVNALADGLLSDEAVVKLLTKYFLWDEDKETLVKKLTNEVEDIKVNLYENFSRASQRKIFKQSLRDTINYIEGLLISKHSLDSYAAKSIAQFGRQHFLLGSSIFIRRGKPLFTNFSWWYCKDDSIVNSLYKILSHYTLTESQLREIARSGQWRSTWGTRKGSNLFGRAAVDLSYQQRQLVIWSQMYDSVYKSGECPSDDVIVDNDALDGWFISQRRNREKEQNKSFIEGRLTDKVAQSEEVYVICHPEDGITPNKVMDCNDYEAKLRWKSRIDQVKKQGIVSETNMIDRRRELQRELHEKRKDL